jgi:hypothetical protein
MQLNVPPDLETLISRCLSSDGYLFESDRLHPISALSVSRRAAPARLYPSFHAVLGNLLGSRHWRQAHSGAVPSYI